MIIMLEKKSVTQANLALDYKIQNLNKAVILLKEGALDDLHLSYA